MVTILHFILTLLRYDLTIFPLMGTLGSLLVYLPGGSCQKGIENSNWILIEFYKNVLVSFASDYSGQTFLVWVGNYWENGEIIATGREHTDFEVVEGEPLQHRKVLNPRGVWPRGEINDYLTSTSSFPLNIFNDKFSVWLSQTFTRTLNVTDFWVHHTLPDDSYSTTILLPLPLILLRSMSLITWGSFL